MTPRTPLLPSSTSSLLALALALVTACGSSPTPKAEHAEASAEPPTADTQQQAAADDTDKPAPELDTSTDRGLAASKFAKRKNGGAVDRKWRKGEGAADIAGGNDGAPNVRISNPSVDGPREATAVRAALREASTQLGRCYTDDTSDKGTAPLVFGMKLRVTPDGEVGDVSFTSTGLPALEGCIRGVLSTQKLEKADAEAEVEFSLILMQR